MTKATELRLLADQELAERLEGTQRELFNLRFQLATSQATDSANLAKLRREIARIMTIQTARKAASQSEGGE